MDKLFRITHRISENGNIVGYRLQNLYDGTTSDEPKQIVWEKARCGSIENVIASGDIHMSLSGTNGFRLKDLPLIKAEDSADSINKMIYVTATIFDKHQLESGRIRENKSLGYQVTNNSNIELKAIRIDTSGNKVGMITIQPHESAYLSRLEVCELVKSVSKDRTIGNAKLIIPDKPEHEKNNYISVKENKPVFIALQDVVSQEDINKYFVHNKSVSRSHSKPVIVMALLKECLRVKSNPLYGDDTDTINMVGNSIADKFLERLTEEPHVLSNKIVIEREYRDDLKNAYGYKVRNNSTKVIEYNRVSNKNEISKEVLNPNSSKIVSKADMVNIVIHHNINCKIEGTSIDVQVSTFKNSPDLFTVVFKAIHILTMDPDKRCHAAELIQSVPEEEYNTFFISEKIKPTINSEVRELRDKIVRDAIADRKVMNKQQKKTQKAVNRLSKLLGL